MDTVPRVWPAGMETVYGPAVKSVPLVAVFWWEDRVTVVAWLRDADSSTVTCAAAPSTTV